MPTDFRHSLLGNGIDDAGASAIAAALEKNKALVVLRCAFLLTRSLGRLLPRGLCVQ
jgi:hypothetical protein